MRRIAIEPALDRAGRCIEDDAEAAEGPAIVRDRHEEACWQTIERGNLAANQRRPAAEPHRTDGQFVRRIHHRILDLREPRIGIHVVQCAEQLLLRVNVS